MEYVSIEEIAERSEKGYPRNVRKAVLDRLVQRGVLGGRDINGTSCIADDEALQRVLRYGIEDFVYNTQGWSFVAIHAPIAQVAASLRSTKGTLAYEANITPHAMSDNLKIRPKPQCRDVFVIKVRDNNWTVIVQTVNWIQGSDSLMGLWLAASLSEMLSTQAIAMWDDDFSGSHLVACKNGDKTQYLGDEANAWEDVQTLLYERGVHVPKCFIASDDNSAPHLHVIDPARIDQADHATLAVPDESQVTCPHALEKLAMMAQAAEEHIENGSDFCNHMINGLWQRVMTMRAAQA